MIKKIELKIFLIIFVLLLIMIGVIIAFNAYSSYTSTVRGITSYVERLYDDKRNPERNDIEGLYAVKVAGPRMLDEELYSDEIKEYVHEIINNDSDYGIIGDYIYRNRSRNGMDKKGGVVILFESKDAISDINKGLVWAFITFRNL